MNKAILTTLLLLLALALGAQTGLYNVSYGATKDEVISILEDQGLEVAEDNGTWVRMSNAGSVPLDSAELSFDENDYTLYQWYLYFVPEEDAEDFDVETYVFEALLDQHGEVYEWDDYLEEYYWYLDETHWIYTGYDWDYYGYWVSYESERPTETDDDDDYYEDE
ncbi:MAG TPA: hypothetical protein PKH19_04025 [Candidatus Syntrophosphaera sp.]|nr:hypothetical protein [Candidatus Syntrophosphaera sp.]